MREYNWNSRGNFLQSKIGAPSNQTSSQNRVLRPGPDNTQRNREKLVIGLTIDDELARATPMADLPSTAACCNDDSLNLRMTGDNAGGERNRETEGLVEREATVGVQEPINAGAVPTILEGTSGRNFQAGILEPHSSIHRLMDGASPDVVGRPTYGEVEKADGLGSKPNIPVVRQEADGPRNLEGSRSLLVRPMAALLSHGPACSHNSGQSATRTVGRSLNSGSSTIKRPDYRSESQVRGSHPKVRFKQQGRLQSTVKLGVGSRQMSSGGLKRRKKMKSTNTNTNKATSPVGSIQGTEGLPGGSISDSNIANMNRLILQNECTMTTAEIWGVGKKLDALYVGEERELLAHLENMEARDVEKWTTRAEAEREGDGQAIFC
ncbi:hypothetical protein Ancab_006837 [Ancistrocladus abbreviatus]